VHDRLAALGAVWRSQQPDGAIASWLIWPRKVRDSSAS